MNKIDWDIRMFNFANYILGRGRTGIALRNIEEIEYDLDRIYVLAHPEITIRMFNWCNETMHEAVLYNHDIPDEHGAAVMARVYNIPWMYFD